MGRARQRQPSEAQTRDRWLEGYALACEVKQTCPAPLVVNVADRDGEIHAWCWDAMRRPPDARAECLLRAQGHRRLANGKAHGH